VIRETAAELFPEVPGALYIFRRWRAIARLASTWCGAQCDDTGSPRATAGRASRKM